MTNLQEIQDDIHRAVEEFEEDELYSEESSEDELMNEDLGVSVYEHGCEHGDYAW